MARARQLLSVNIGDARFRACPPSRDEREVGFGQVDDFMGRHPCSFGRIEASGGMRNAVLTTECLWLTRIWSCS